MARSESSDNREKNQRWDNPSGWLRLTRYESVPYIIDALLDLPTHREFNQSELADYAGVSRQSVNRHLEVLFAAEIVEPVPKTRPQRYRFNEGSRVSKALIELDGAMNAVGIETSCNQG